MSTRGTRTGEIIKALQTYPHGLCPKSSVGTATLPTQETRVDDGTKADADSASAKAQNVPKEFLDVFMLFVSAGGFNNCYCGPIESTRRCRESYLSTSCDGESPSTFLRCVDHLFPP